MLGIYIVCEKGELEIKSLLLVLSLLKYIEDKRISLNILFPRDQEKNIKSLKQFLSLGCHIIPFNNSLIELLNNRNLAGNRVSNKLFFLQHIDTSLSRSIFLDSDMLLMRSFNPEQLIIDESFTAKQADRANVVFWKEIYQILNIDFPRDLIECTVDKTLIPPYFNAGFISIHPLIGSLLFETWCDLFLKLSENDILSKRLYNPFNRDQVSLALAVQKLKLSKKMLPEVYNFPVKSKLINDDIIFAHYHDANTIFTNNILLSEYEDHVFNNPLINKIINKNISWKWVFKSGLKRKFVRNSLFLNLSGRFRLPK